MIDHKPRILWGITASVAAIRASLLGRLLLDVGQVRAIVTPRAKHFLSEQPVEIELYDDEREWAEWRELGDPVLHIELRKWADVLVIAPLTADCLAKLSVGICDNLLLSVARAWDFTKPIVLAPAMNTRMWEHPVTAGQLEILRGWGITIVEPVEKKLACADVGIGALAPPDQVTRAVQRAITHYAARQSTMEEAVDD